VSLCPCGPYVGKSNWDMPAMQKGLQFTDALFIEMKNGRREGGVGLTGGEHLGEVFERAGAA
jgi:hypothetical protein